MRTASDKNFQDLILPHGVFGYFLFTNFTLLNVGICHYPVAEIHHFVFSEK